MHTSPIEIECLDHLVLTVADIGKTMVFYSEVFGMRVEHFDGGRTGLHFGSQKINLHLHHHEFSPRAEHPVPGSADLCLISTTPMDAVLQALADHEVPVEMGPVSKIGARGPMTSVYVRDPDHNLIEIACY